MQSARQNAQVIQDYLTKEIHSGNILGPFNPQSFTNLHINRFGVIPKKHQPGKWRLITDLSFPDSASVNNGIDPSLCSLVYISVEQVAETALKLGPGSLLAKIDIKSAYRLIPVHPLDRHMLGMEWEGNVYVDGMLPFGLRSAPKIFNAVADALEWCVAKQGVTHIFHYLDDFINCNGTPTIRHMQSESAYSVSGMRQAWSTPSSRKTRGASHLASLFGNHDRYGKGGTPPPS